MRKFVSVLILALAASANAQDAQQVLFINANIFNGTEDRM